MTIFLYIIKDKPSWHRGQSSGTVQSLQSTEWPYWGRWLWGRHWGREWDLRTSPSLQAPQSTPAVNTHTQTDRVPLKHNPGFKRDTSPGQHLNLSQANKMTKLAFTCNPQASALLLCLKEQGFTESEISHIEWKHHVGFQIVSSSSILQKCSCIKCTSQFCQRNRWFYVQKTHITETSSVVVFVEVEEPTNWL